MKSSNNVVIRRITYKDSVTDKEYRFITNELTLPPGVIAFLYKLRWDIEKIFDQIKNKLIEKKAWAKSQNAKIQQAHFITLAHNLMVLLNHQIETEEGIIDQKSQGKRTQRRAEEVKQAEGKANKSTYWCELGKGSLSAVFNLSDGYAPLSGKSNSLAGSYRPSETSYAVLFALKFSHRSVEARFTSLPTSEVFLNFWQSF